MAVAATVAEGIARLDEVSGSDLLAIVFAGLVGGILWNLLTWLFGMYLRSHRDSVHARNVNDRWQDSARDTAHVDPPNSPAPAQSPSTERA